MIHDRHIHGKTCYDVFGVCAVEAEVHVLTGDRRITRLDVVQDCGERYISVML